MLKTTLKIAVLLLGMLPFIGFTQDKKGDSKATPAATTTPPKIDPPKTGPKPYKEVITDKAKTTKGLFLQHTNHGVIQMYVACTFVFCMYIF